MSDASNSSGNTAPKTNGIPTEVAPGTSTKEGISQAAEAVAQKYKVKVDGAEMEVDLQELLTGYQTRKSSDKAFREASMLRKQSEEFIHLLKTNPAKVLTDPRIGHDMRKLAEEYLAAQLEDEMMDPKDRELRDAKKQLQEIEEEKKRKAAEEEESRKTELRQKYAADYQSQILNALDKSGLPKSELTVKRMAYYLQQGLKRGYSLEAMDVVDLVRQDYISEQKALFGGLDGDALLSILGSDVADKIRKHDIAKLKNPHQGLRTPEKQPSGDSERPQKKSLSKEEWKKKMERMKRGEE